MTAQHACIPGKMVTFPGSSNTQVMFPIILLEVAVVRIVHHFTGWQIRGAHLSVPYKTEGGSMKITVLVDEREVELVQNNEEENEERCAKFDVFAEGKRLTVKAEMRGRAMLCPQLNDEDPCGDLYVSIKFDV